VTAETLNRACSARPVAPTEAEVLEAVDRLSAIGEPIIFRRIMQNKMVGYTVDAAKEIACAAIAALKTKELKG